MTTQQRILKRALELFNEKGIEYTGMREIAQDLDLHIGNVSYYFPKKEDLVGAVALQLRELNNKTIVHRENLSMKDFLEMTQLVFANHYQFRCLMKSFAHLMEQYPSLAAAYKPIEKKRIASYVIIIEELVENGYLKKVTSDVMDYFTSCLSLIVRFWISEASITYRNESYNWQSAHYLTMIANMFLPYTKKSGEKEIAVFLKSLAGKAKSKKSTKLKPKKR